MDDTPRPMRWVLLAALIALLAAFQFVLLDPTPEQKDERRYSNLSDLPPGKALLTYIGTLLSGPFRAVAVDILWIDYNDLADEKRYSEAIDILRLIVHLQPHNPEVWAVLGHDLCYNLPAVAPEKERYRLYSSGLELLREGIRANPGDPYLCYELAWKLQHKVTWAEGWFDEELIQRIMDDGDLQAKLSPDGAWDGKKRTPFSLARPWLERSRGILIDEMARRENEPWRNQEGLLFTPELMDTYLLLGLYKESMYLWSPPRRRNAEALETLRAAIAHTRSILDKYGAYLSIIYARRLAMYKHIEEILLFDSLAPPLPPDASPDQQAARRAHSLELLRRMEEVIVEFETLDEGYVYASAKRLKQEITHDSGELDDMPYAARLVPPRTEGPVEIPANLWPPGRDLDIALLQPPATDKENPPPASASLDVTNGSSVPLHARIAAMVAGNYLLVTEAIIEPHGTRTFADVELDYRKPTYLFISPARLPDSPDDPILYVIRRMK